MPARSVCVLEGAGAGSRWQRQRVSNLVVLSAAIFGQVCSGAIFEVPHGEVDQEICAASEVTPDHGAAPKLKGKAAEEKRAKSSDASPGEGEKAGSTSNVQPMKGEVPEDGLSEAGKEALGIIKASITDMFRETIKLTKPWSIRKFFKLAPDYDSPEFDNTYADIRFAFGDFETAFVKNPNDLEPLKKNFAKALEMYASLFPHLRRAKAFQICNVHLINSAGHTVTYEAKQVFDCTRQWQKDYKRILADFHRRIQSLPASDIKTLLRHPNHQRYVPFIKAVRADHPHPLPAQETAKNYVLSNFKRLADLKDEVVSRASQLTRKQGSDSEKEEAVASLNETEGGTKSAPRAKDGSLENKKELEVKTILTLREEREKPFLRSNEKVAKALEKNLLEGLRWATFDYCLNAASIAVPKDRYAYANAKLGVTREAGEAMRAAVAEEGHRVWTQYLSKMKNLNGLDADAALLPVEIANLASQGKMRLPPNKKGLTYEQVNQQGIQAISAVSKLLGDRVEAIIGEGRVLWECFKSPKAACDFQVVHGGKDAGSFIWAIFPSDGRTGVPVVHGFNAAFLDAALRMEAEEKPLSSESRKYFQDGLLHALMNRYIQMIPEGAHGDGFKLLRRYAKSFESLRSLVIASACDEFESAVFAECDKLGPVRKVKSRLETELPNAEALKKAWARSLMRINAVQDRDEMKAAYEQHADLMAFDVSSVLPKERYTPSFRDSWDLETEVLHIAPISTERKSYSRLVQSLAEVAVIDAIAKRKSASPSQVDEEVIIPLIRAPQETTFDDFIRILGGDAKDPGYWRGVIRRQYEETAQELEAAMQKLRQKLAAQAVMPSSEAENKGTAPADGEVRGKNQPRRPNPEVSVDVDEADQGNKAQSLS